MRIATIGVFAILLAACSFTVTTPKTQTDENPSLSESSSGIITILNTSSYDDGYGTFFVIGELRNDGAVALQNIQLRITIRDFEGKSILVDPFSNIIESELFNPYLDMLFPGQVSGFEYSLEAQAGTPASYEISYFASEISSAVPGNVEVENAQFLNDTYGFSYIVGELVNREVFPIQIVGLAGAVLDTDGKPISSNNTLHMVKYLAAAGSHNGRDRVPFMISMYGSFAPNTSWTTYITAIKSDFIPEAPVALQVTNEYLDTYGYYHLIGTIQNKGTEQISFYIQGGLYDSGGRVLDANYYALPINLDPNATQPFDMVYWNLVNRNDELQTRIASHTVQIDPAWVKSTSYEHYTLEVSDISEEKEENGIWRFHGSVINDCGKPLAYEVVFISITDDRSRLVATSQQTLYPEDQVIAAGVSTAFDMEIDLDLAGDSAGFLYSIVALGETNDFINSHK